MKALTRNQVIALWNKNKLYLNHFVCPDCRDVLAEIEFEGGTYEWALGCNNEQCNNHHYYHPRTGEEL